ncbi:6526_t:CDS:2, partial [Dentiscutata erythropus]
QMFNGRREGEANVREEVEEAKEIEREREIGEASIVKIAARKAEVLIKSIVSDNSYFPRKMVCDALDLDNEEAEEEMYSNCRVDILKRLILSLMTMQKTELTRSFVNPHRNFEIPTTNQVFEMETGKNDMVLLPGNINDYRITPQDVRSQFSVDQPLKSKISLIDNKIDMFIFYPAIPVHIPISSPIRIILHPMFHQMTYSKAVQYLKDKSNGSYVVKPTTKGFGYIAITCKLFVNIYLHVYIVEKDKAGVSVGLRLEVEGCKYIYSDLGELIVQYVEPKARRAEDLMAHAKFKSSVENLNSLEMNPNHSSYGFCFDYEMP